MYSTKDLDRFLDPEELRDTLRKMAALDVVLCEEDWLRCYSYTPDWTDGVALARVDNGAGDEMWVFFAPAGVMIKGFAHESPVSPHAQEEHRVWPGIYDGVPPDLLRLLDADSIGKGDVTFCIWRTPEDDRWRLGNVELPNGEDDGSELLLAMILTDADAFCEWAGDYFDTGLRDDVVRELYSGGKMTEEMVRALNPDRDVEEAARELKALGAYAP